ncbi:MAG: TetR/AcrR family transcriptional regulator [Polyangiaceae bacterium]
MRRTRRLLREALVELTLERGWDSVSVLDVCAKADIGRSTFYVHFADKEDLLLSGFDDLHAGLDAHCAVRAQPFAFAEPLLAHAAENHDLFRAVVGRQSGQQCNGDSATSLRTSFLSNSPVCKFERPSVIALRTSLRVVSWKCS